MSRPTGKVTSTPLPAGTGQDAGRIVPCSTTKGTAVDDSRAREGSRPTRVLLSASSIDVPLWDRTPGRPGYPLGYEETGVSTELAERIETWNTRYTSAVFEEWSPAEEAAFARDGAALADELRRELGPEVEVLYGDGVRGPADDRPRPTPSADGDDYRWDVG